MKYSKLFIIALSFIVAMGAKGQQKLTLEELIPGGENFYKYYPQTLRGVAWYGEQLTHKKGDSILVLGADKKAEKEVLLTTEELNNALPLKNKLKNLNSAHLGKVMGNVLITTKENIHIYNLQQKNVPATFNINAGIENTDISEQGLNLAYTQANNLYIQNRKGEEVAITSETNPRIVCGQSVHQNEFGISKGTFWSPKGNLLAYYRMDESMVDAYPLVDVAPRMAKLKERVYPMAGAKSHHVTIGIYDVEVKKNIFLQTGLPKEKFLTNIAWSPDEKTIYVAELNRGQDTCIVNSYDTSTGKKIATLFTETHPKYVEPQEPILFVKNDDTKFIWQSKRDGYNHVYLYSKEGKLLKQITKGNFDVTSVLGFDEKGETLFYTSTEESPIEKHIYKIGLKNEKKVKLTHEEGVHTGKLSPSGNLLSDFYQSQNNPGKLALTNTNTKTNKPTIINEAKNPYKDIALPEITLGSLKANDGKTDLYYRLVKPANLDASKNYPVIVYVYGGPHSQMVSNTWLGAARGWDIYMAEKGYIVFTLDNRGTENRGLDFENITHRQLGVVETEDQMAGVDFLKSQAYVDADRIGVHGWSFGGFMTLNMMLRHPQTFKVGVAGGPVTDWNYYEIMYGERYMDSPQENPEGYKNTSMVDRIGDLQGRLLLIHGDEDPVVLMQHTSKLVKAAVDKRVHPDMFIYPGHEHNVMGKDRVHLYEHITRYFEDFLK